MTGRREDRILKAFTGLEGGLVASGSTCGVITGGAFGIALMHDEALRKRGMHAETEVMFLIGEYVRWFQNNFDSPFCRERSGVDFYTTKGQLRYFFPGDRIGKCLWHIRGAIRHLHAYQKNLLLEKDMQPEIIQAEPIHCAQAVLKEIRQRTGIGDPLLERLSFIFDGGVGFQGGICGALAGAILAVNLLLGMDIRNTSYLKTIKNFGVGHINLLLDKPIGDPEPFGVGKNIVQRFREKAGSIECCSITSKRFAGWTDFQKHITTSDQCAGLIEFVVNEASDTIQRLR